MSTTEHEPQLALADTISGPVVDAPGVPAARPLRAWQNAALEKYFDPAREEPADYLVTATPGAGKTTFALALARRLREVAGHDLEEVASTRLVVHAARLIGDRLAPIDACRVAFVEALSDDPAIREALERALAARLDGTIPLGRDAELRVALDR